MINLEILESLLTNPQAASFLLSLLDPKELAIFKKFTFSKRKVEWFGGRLVSKYSLFQWQRSPSLPSFFRNQVILPDDLGRPAVQDLDNESKFALSLSHSKKYAMAMTSPYKRCGIDIQLCSPRLIVVRGRFTHEQELQGLPESLEELNGLALIWTAKEAVKKCWLSDSPSFLEGIRFLGCQQEQKSEGWIAKCQIPDYSGEITIHSMQWKNYMLSYCLGESYA